MTVGIYIRVSTEEQVKEGFSISAQRNKLEAYCKVQDWVDYKFYADEGISAKNTDRPQLQQMIKHIEEGKINVVLVYRLDRLTRSVMDLYKLLEVFEKYDCKFKSATEVYDTTSAMGRMFITLVAALAQFERENLGERVRMGQIEKARQGKFSANAPFGFNKVDDKLIIDNEQKEIVLDMIEKVKQGHSMRQLANYLNDSGIPTIRGYQWHITSILSILKNPVLHGSMRWRDEIIEDTHEPIIVKEEHDHVIKLISDRQLKKKRKVNSFFVYQMKLICSICGNHLTSERHVYKRKDESLSEHNRYRCQVCALARRKAISVSEKQLEFGFVNYMKNLTIEKVPETNKQKEDPTLKIKKDIGKIEKQREKYQRAWANELITDTEFGDRMKETQRSLIELYESLKEHEPITDTTYDTEQVLEIANNFNLNWQHLTPKEKHQFLNLFIKAIKFRKEEKYAIVEDVIFY